MERTLNNLFVKNIDFGSEEYIKDLLIRANPSLELTVVNPFVGVVAYPSEDFLSPALAYDKTTQFAASHYVGHIEMLLPPFTSPVNIGLSYTILEFMLDGVKRQFLQISDASTISQGVAFGDFINNLYPKAGDVLPFNRHAIHILSNIDLYGAVYTANAGAGAPFLPVSAAPGVATPAIEFEFAISGFRAILQ